MEPRLTSRRWQWVTLTVAVSALLRCSDANGPTVASCTGPVTLTATSALEPNFEWTPNCLVDQLTVEEDIAPSAGGPQPRWIIQARVTGRGARAPLAYGQVPTPMEELLTATPLVAGHEYTVRVYAAMVEVGVATFRP